MLPAHRPFLIVTALLTLVSSHGDPLRAAPPPLPTPAAAITSRHWDAQWIAPADYPGRNYGVFHFRKTLELAAAPARFVVHVSADNRYRLFVNGTPVNIGPSLGDLEHWRFDSLDLAPYLGPGRNVIAATVWNFGVDAAVAQTTNRTAFIVQGDTPTEAAVNTDASWRVCVDSAYTPITGFGAKLQTYIVVGPGDNVDGTRYPWGWEAPGFDDTAWPSAITLRPGEPRGTSTDGQWLLVPRTIPLMASHEVRLQRLRRSEGIDPPAAFLAGGHPIEIPPHSTVRLLCDQNEITTAYPELRVSGGRGSTVTLTYAESLYEGPDVPSSKRKGNRDEVQGKHLRGFEDTFHPDGGANRLFRPLARRAYRYLQLTATTGDAPLTVLDLKGDYTGYPFVERARFASSDSSLTPIWTNAWRTLRIGSHESFNDTAYYEQLSYVGDCRIEALLALAVDGDDRLVRKVISAFDESRNANGLTSSRWPDSRHQLIPPYALIWIDMVHDYWRWRDDPAFVRHQLGGVREVLRYFTEHSDPATGSYTGRRWWNFVDWIPAWGPDPVTGLGGVPPRDDQGTSAVLDLQYVYTLQHAADLFTAFGYAEDAARCTARATTLRRFIVDTCWDEHRGLVADTPEKLTYSQHANAYFILTAAAAAPTLAAVAEHMITDPDLPTPTLYFKFYTHQALIAAGLGNRYLEQLGSWHDTISLGLSTLPETPDLTTRSDSHAWGAHPILEFLGTVCGITPAEPGFKSVRIAPHLGELTFVRGALPHPQGEIAVDFARIGEHGLRGTVVLPEGLYGVLDWHGQPLPLHPGPQQIELN